MFQRIAARVLCLAALAVGMPAIQPALAADNEDKPSMTLAAVRIEEMSTLASRWGRVIDYLDKTADVDLQFYTTTSYASVIEAMLSGFVDIASLGPESYLVAHEKSNGDIVPLVSYTLPPDMYNDKACACYRGALVTMKGSGLDSIESLKGKVLALVDPASTSGNALPRALFVDKIGGANLEDYFGRVFYSGSHSASARAVYGGKADAAFLSLGVLRNLVSSGEMNKDDFNYLWMSPEIPIDVIAVDKKRMSPELMKRLTGAFVGMSDTEEGRQVLKASTWSGFVPADDSRFDVLRKILSAHKE